MKVEWRVIPSFPNYEASNSGLIRRRLNEKVLKSKDIDNRLYQVVSIYTAGKKFTKKVARLVWEAFTGCECDMTIDHIDRNPLNNTIENLRCVSNEENAKNRNIYRGENKYNLTDELRKEIITKYYNNDLTTWGIMKQYNLPLNYITTVIKRGSWNKFYDESDKIQRIKDNSSEDNQI